MKFSYSKLLTPFLFALIVCSCSKESTNSSNAAGTADNATGTNGSLSRFTIVDNYLYTVTNHYLSTYDISDLANPVRTNQSDLNFDIETIYPYKNHLFIGTRTGLYIYSISNPAAPILEGEASHARSCDPVVANDSIAFVTLKGSSDCGPAVSGLYVHDIRNIFSPTLIKTIQFSNPEGLGLLGSTLYVCCNSDGLKVFNVANPSNPVEIRTVTGPYFKDVIPYGNLLICYVSTGIMLYDITDPTNPVEVKLIENT